MARTPWVVDGRGIAMKVKNARGLKNWRSDASISCPNCNYTITNAHVAQEWPGLPAGVKFDPSDQELLEHLAAKVGIGNARPHVLIDEFILTLEDYNGICYTHPENLPGVKQDGGSIHFFHKTTKAYTTGERKRRKITSDMHSGGEVRWHKTGKTRPVIENGIQKGCKKIMVLYMTSAKGSKAEKTHWVMHQYHLGTEEDEREGEFVVSKVFYQQQSKQCEKNDPDVIQEDVGTSSGKGDPVTPKTNTPLPPRSGKPHSCLDGIKEEELPPALSPQAVYLDATIHLHSKGNDAECDSQKDFWNGALDDSMWPAAGESQFLEDSQELINPYSLFCREMLENHSCQQSIEEENSIPCLAECGRIGGNELEAGNSMPGLSQSGHTGSNELVVGNSIPGLAKSDSIEGNEPKSSKERVEAQNSMSGHGAIGRNEPERELNKPVDLTLANIELDTPPDGLITFSQFSSSQDTESLLGWINKELGLGESQSQGSK